MSKENVIQDYLIESNPAPLPRGYIEEPKRVENPKYTVQERKYGEFCKIQSEKGQIHKIKMHATYSTVELRNLGLRESPSGGGNEKTYVVGGVKMRATLTGFDLDGENWKIIEISENKDRKTWFNELQEDFYNITGKYSRAEIL